MLPLDNDFVKELTKPTQFQEFEGQYVKELERARDSVFIEICNEFKQGLDHRYVANRYFKNSKTITKEKLGVWLESVCHILDMYSLPWLKKAAPLADETRALKIEVQTLKAENTAYQKRIIELQNRLIETQEKQLNSVKSTVEAEMKSYSTAVKSTVQAEMQSYSSVVAKTCSTAFAPKKLQAVVQKVAEKTERSQNVIIYGLKEDSDELIQGKVEAVLAEVGEKPTISDCCRIGTKTDSSIRPVKFSLKSQAHVTQVLKNARKLRSIDGFRSVYICPDRSLEERKAYKKLVEEVKMKRDTETDKVHFIRHNKVVSHSKNCKPLRSGNE